MKITDEQNLVSRINFAKLCGVTPTSITRACKSALAPATVGLRVDANHPSAVKYRKRQESANDPSIPDELHDTVASWCKDNNCYSIKGVARSGIVGRIRAKRILAELVGTTPDSSAETVARESEGLQSEGSPPDPAPAPAPSGHTARNERKKRDAPPPKTAVGIPDNITEYADLTLREIITRFGSDAMFVDFLKALKSIEDINEKRLKNAQTEGTLVARELVRIGVIDVVDSAMRKLLTAGTKKIARMAHSMTKAGETIEKIEEEVKDQVGQYVKNIKIKSAKALDR
jgi:HAMP domain-containing protein